MSESKATTFKLAGDAYRQIKNGQRLSAAARAAIIAAKPIEFREKEVSCSPEIAEEILSWFKDHEKHAELSKNRRWVVWICQRAILSMEAALSPDRKNE